MEKNYNFTGNNSELKNKARVLRYNMTRQERRLWFDFLKNYPLKWYRQRPIENYIVDFYCSKAKLVIELDGSQHYMPEGERYDHKRTKVLEKYGLKVLRFSNLDVDTNFIGVCQYIDQVVHNRVG